MADFISIDRDILVKLLVLEFLVFRVHVNELPFRLSRETRRKFAPANSTEILRVEASSSTEHTHLLHQVTLGGAKLPAVEIARAVAGLEIISRFLGLLLRRLVKVDTSSLHEIFDAIILLKYFI